MTAKVTFKFDYNGRTETIERSGFRYPEQIDEIARDMITTGIYGVDVYDKYELTTGYSQVVMNTFRSGPGLRYVIKLITEEGVVPCDEFLATIQVGHAVRDELVKIGYLEPESTLTQDPETGAITEEEDPMTEVLTKFNKEWDEATPEPVAEPIAAQVSKRRTQFTADGRSTVFVDQIKQFVEAAENRIFAAQNHEEAMEIEQALKRAVTGYCELM